MSELQCVVVTPERTELDVPAETVTVPMYDGEMGILKGHSPLVGRLGYGLLRIRAAQGVQTYFIEGGFVQVQDNVVSVLTDKLISAEEITNSSASAALKAALEMPSDAPDLAAVRDKAVQRARAMSRIAG
ncbi:MAG: ATP synthase F1 subunit epsilon [Planctomycetales bacterium]|nr:ATP synthase F1 subunit epsilon [Planctomycetales bacterium]